MDNGRRSFLAAALAWIAPVVASLWPRRALSAPPRPRGLGPFRRPSRPAAPGPVTYDCKDPAFDQAVRNMGEYRRSHRVYADAGLMFDEMHAHLCATGHSVLCCDDPERLRWGYATFDSTPGAPEDMVTWQTGMVGFKALMARLDEHGASGLPRSFGTSPSEDAVTILRDCLRSSEGRLRLAVAYQAAGRVRFERGLGPLPST